MLIIINRMTILIKTMSLKLLMVMDKKDAIIDNASGRGKTTRKENKNMNTSVLVNKCMSTTNNTG
jgi:hypothetical protein